nr:hypothetical protein [Sneathiella glossodoripedis]
MDNEARQHALSLGLALRLSHSLSGGTQGILPRTKLISKENEIILEVPDDLSALLGVQVNNRLAALAGCLGKSHSIRIREDL